MNSYFGPFRPRQHDIASKQAQVPKTNISPCPWLLTIRLAFFMVVERDEARYQRGHSAQYSGFKLATSTFVLSILEFIVIATFHKHCTFNITYNMFYFK